VTQHASFSDKLAYFVKHGKDTASFHEFDNHNLKLNVAGRGLKHEKFNDVRTVENMDESAVHSFKDARKSSTKVRNRVIELNMNRVDILLLIFHATISCIV